MESAAFPSGSKQRVAEWNTSGEKAYAWVCMNWPNLLKAPAKDNDIDLGRFQTWGLDHAAISIQHRIAISHLSISYLLMCLPCFSRSPTNNGFFSIFDMAIPY